MEENLPIVERRISDQQAEDEELDLDLDACQEPEEDPSHTRRLVQADKLVREGMANLEDEWLRIPILDTEEVGVFIRAPLPPAALHPQLVIRFQRASDREVVFSQAKEIFTGFLPGPTTTDLQAETATFNWTPHPLSMETVALIHAISLGETIARGLVQILRGGSASDELAKVRMTLDERRAYGDSLARAFEEHALLRLPIIGLVHLLGYLPGLEESDDPLLLAYQCDADLWSGKSGQGFHLAIRVPGLVDVGRRDELSELLAAIFRRRLDVWLEPSEDIDLLGEWRDLDQTCLWSATGRPELSFSAFVRSLKGLIRFSRSLAVELSRNQEPFALIGDLLRLRGQLSRTGEQKNLASGEQKSTGWGGEASWKSVLAELDKKVGQASEHEEGLGSGDAKLSAPEKPVMPEQPKPPPRAKKSPPPRARLDSETVREVVKRLGAEEAAEMDVFLSHPGFNVEKTVKIMSIVLSVSEEEAKTFCESAPCLLRGPVTRSKAAQMKTILEGTGARIRVVSSEAET